MSNPLTTVRQALWAVLRNDATLASFMTSGRYYTFDDGSFLPRKIARSDCPCLAIYPGAIPYSWATDAKQEIRCALDCVGFAAGVSAEAAEQLYWNVYKAAYSGFPNLSLDNVAGIAFGSPSIAAHGAHDGAVEFW